MASLAGLFGNNKGFNAATVEPTQDYPPMKAGIYKAIVSASSIEQSKSGTGTNLVLTFKVVEGEYKGREQRVWLCVQHSNQQTQEIAQRNFSAICHAVNKLQVTSTEQIHGIPLLIRVALEPDNRDPDKLQNRVKGYMPLQAANQPAEPVAAEDDVNSDIPW